MEVIKTKQQLDATIASFKEEVKSYGDNCGYRKFIYVFGSDIEREIIDTFNKGRTFQFDVDNVAAPVNKSIFEMVPMLFAEICYCASKDWLLVEPHQYQFFVVIGNAYYRYTRHENRGRFDIVDDNSREIVGKKWEEENPHPNYTNVLTNKTIVAWTNWLLKRKQAAEEILEADKQKAEAFIARLKEIPQELCKEYKIGDKNGAIELCGLRLTYNIGKHYYIDYCIDRTIYSADSFIKIAEMLASKIGAAI